MAEDIAEVDEFLEPVTIPEDGDDLDAPSVEPAFTRLTNRTRYLLERSGIELPGGTRHVWPDEHVFEMGAKLPVGTELRYSPPRSIPFCFGPAQGVPGQLSMQYMAAIGGPGITFGSSPATWQWHIALPVGCVIRTLRLLAELGTNPNAIGLTANVYPHSSGGDPGTPTEIADITEPGLGDRLLEQTGIEYVVSERNILLVHVVLPSAMATHQVTLRTLIIEADVGRASGPG